ncbi:MAG: hypothetical protein EP338_02125 [Bacteroidetes bacterium]|nr:MAG: hypothetical protein EP338_02125 [Bacteroidota bacterium]
MKADHQTHIFELIKLQLPAGESLGYAVGEVLSMSQDAVYRRYRGETLLTIYELEKLCLHYGISLDTIFGMKKNQVAFQFQGLESYDFSMVEYLRGIRDGLLQIKAHPNPGLTIAVDNTPLLQLFNYPHLVRFKLFFWAKTHLLIPEFQNQSFGYEKFSEDAFGLGHECLKLYNSIPSVEIFDPELLRGFVREIYYYFNARHFEDPSYALQLLETLSRFVDHLKQQAACGQKFIVNTEPPATGNNFEMYLNETVNTNSTIYYENDLQQGIYVAHNVLNTLHTEDKAYVKDSLQILKRQLANSISISQTNERERNQYFHRIQEMIRKYQERIRLELEM